MEAAPIAGHSYGLRQRAVRRSVRSPLPDRTAAIGKGWRRGAEAWALACGDRSSGSGFLGTPRTFAHARPSGGPARPPAGEGAQNSQICMPRKPTPGRQGPAPDRRLACRSPLRGLVTWRVGCGRRGVCRRNCSAAADTGADARPGHQGRPDRDAPAFRDAAVLRPPATRHILIWLD